MRIALAQINATLGDFAANQTKILEFTARALAKRCDLVVFPEASLFGYHPVDLLERRSVVLAQEECLKQIHKTMPKGIAIVMGAIVRNPSQLGKGYWNAAVFLERGKKPRVFPKQLLPTYDVFDEGRHIEPGRLHKNILRFKGKRFLVTICEDVWAWPVPGNPNYAKYGKNPLLEVKRGSIDFILNLSASPFTHSKLDSRRRVVKKTATHFGKPMVYVNLVGGQDELIFDGGSYAIDGKGKTVAQSVRFSEDLNIVEFDFKKHFDGGTRELDDNPDAVLRSALALGIRDFAAKTGFKKVHVGLSGGIDSALVACLAVDALGPMNVTAVFLPGPFTSPDSTRWSKELAENLGIRWLEFAIGDNYQSVLSGLEKVYGKLPFDLVNENLQARLRGLYLMAVSNREGSLLLGTTNKSEMAVGYGTLYGDMIGGLLPIGDMLKTEVFSLSRHYNSEGEVIPSGIIERPPSAELRENQTDQDSLPPYDVLDRAIVKLVEGLSAPVGPVETRVLQMMMKSEFKRWQAPPILKVSDHAFGRGRRFPIAHHAQG
jgi:NAD+ synthase (glutamine-hydrolysing)